MTPGVSAQVSRLEKLLAVVQLRAHDARPVRTLFQRTGRIDAEGVVPRVAVVPSAVAPAAAPAAALRAESPTGKFPRPDAVVPVAPVSGAVRKSPTPETAPVSSVAPANAAAKTPERDIASARVPVPAASAVRQTMLGTAPAAAFTAGPAPAPAPAVQAPAPPIAASAATASIATSATEITRPQILDAPVANFKDARTDSFGSAFDDALTL
jgi:hypothetical protein